MLCRTHTNEEHEDRPSQLAGKERMATQLKRGPLSREPVDAGQPGLAAVAELPPDSPTRKPVDLDAAEQAAAGLLRALGADIESEHLRETPRRVAAAYGELLTPVPFSATTFPNDEQLRRAGAGRGDPFQSLCMHHLLPFQGVAHVAYLPGDRLIGLSKLARVVELFARDLQLQERLVTQVADWVEENLRPRGVGVVLEAEHLCMSLRGVQKPGARTVTSALRGGVKDDPRTRAEFLSLIADK